MTMIDVNELFDHWCSMPPVNESVAHFLGIKPQIKTHESSDLGQAQTEKAFADFNKLVNGGSTDGG